MASQQRILNVTRGCWRKPGQVERAIANGACVWVEFGVSVRDSTILEAIAARNEQAKNREPLAYAEIPGLVYKPAVSGQMASGEAAALVRAAHEFCMIRVSKPLAPDACWPDEMLIGSGLDSLCAAQKGEVMPKVWNEWVRP